ncbi:unnamed protein product [Urochloa decumbens]|uniref:Uncharacterized protein n=1 Tax=Urochloa decumbens TaxID=240449 RepID=A0ABC9B951_9POAL
MTTPGSKAMAAGLTVMLLSVGAGIHSCHSGGFGLVLCFTGVLVGANLVAVGVRMAEEDPAAHMGPAAVAGARALSAFLRRNLGVVGLLMACCAVTTVSSGEAGPALGFGAFALLLLGLYRINAAVIG